MNDPPTPDATTACLLGLLNEEAVCRGPNSPGVAALLNEHAGHAEFSRLAATYMRLCWPAAPAA